MILQYFFHYECFCLFAGSTTQTATTTALSSSSKLWQSSIRVMLVLLMVPTIVTSSARASVARERVRSVLDSCYRCMFDDTTVIACRIIVSFGSHSTCICFGNHCVVTALLTVICLFVCVCVYRIGWLLKVFKRLVDLSRSFKNNCRQLYNTPTPERLSLHAKFVLFETRYLFICVSIHQHTNPPLT
jgi:hypothetical protein